MAKAKDITGQIFGMLTALERVFDYPNKGVYWRCICDCAGIETIVRSQHLFTGRTRSCGCLLSKPKNPLNTSSLRECSYCKKVKSIDSFGKDITSSGGHKYCCKSCEKERHRKDPRKNMLSGAKVRARKNNLPFSISIDDIVIPETCPLLGIPLFTGDSGPTWNSPSLDKIIPELGYVKDNVIVISRKANVVKNDLSLEQLQSLIENLRKIIDSKRSQSCGNPESICESLSKSRGKS